MKNIYNTLKNSDGAIESLYKKMFVVQYKNIFIPELCLAMKNNVSFSEPSKKYIISLNRGLFDHCVYLLRLDRMDKDIVDIIRDLYLQFKIYNFDSDDLVNTKIQAIGSHNLDYSVIISDNFKTFKEEKVFLSVLPFFNKKDGNLMLDEITRNYSK